MEGIGASRIDDVGISSGLVSLSQQTRVSRPTRNVHLGRLRRLTSLSVPQNVVSHTFIPSIVRIIVGWRELPRPCVAIPC